MHPVSTQERHSVQLETERLSAGEGPVDDGCEGVCVWVEKEVGSAGVSMGVDLWLAAGKE
jgi:hypothetical protein